MGLNYGYPDYVEDNILNGAKINKVFYNDGIIYLDTDKGGFGLEPYGDCCAHCYITDVDGSETLEGGTILEIQDLERPSILKEDAFYYSEVSEVWGHRIVTDKGICTVGMRVDHNGYYGGCLNVTKGCIENGPKLTDFS